MGAVWFVWQGFRRKWLYGSQRVNEKRYLASLQKNWKVKNALGHGFIDASVTWMSLLIIVGLYGLYFSFTGNTLLYSLLVFLIIILSNSFAIRLWFRWYMTLTRTFSNHEPVKWFGYALMCLILSLLVHFFFVFLWCRMITLVDDHIQVGSFVDQYLPFLSTDYLALLVNSIFIQHIRTIQVSVWVVFALTVFDVVGNNRRKR